MVVYVLCLKSVSIFNHRKQLDVVIPAFWPPHHPAFETGAQDFDREQAEKNRRPDPPGHFRYVERDAEVLGEIPCHKGVQVAFYTGFIVYILQVVGNTLVNHIHAIGDLPKGVAKHNPVHDLALTLGEYGIGFHSYATPQGSSTPHFVKIASIFSRSVGV